MSLEDCRFTINHWSAVIKQAQRMGYRFYFFNDYAKRTLEEERIILLRHDIDVSLKMAVLLAKVETALGVPATYFIRVHSSFYDTLTKESLDYLRTLAKMNVEIGLHYERQFYEAIGEDHMEMLTKDARALSDILGRPIKGCAAHRGGSLPPFDITTVQRAGLSYEAYAPPFFKDVKYISDSKGYWREGCLCQWLERANHLTVLTHPVWWFDLDMEKDQLLSRIQNGD